uniref:Uncharacterized protein n=1 Tax=Anopheles dirus TaxID=7168 RepID=A0A182NWJ3_9DIPT
MERKSAPAGTRFSAGRIEMIGIHAGTRVASYREARSENPRCQNCARLAVRPHIGGSCGSRQQTTIIVPSNADYRDLSRSSRTG